MCCCTVLLASSGDLCGDHSSIRQLFRIGLTKMVKYIPQVRLDCRELGSCFGDLGLES
jgi:hypothetical protein